MKTKRTYKRSVIDIILKVLLALFLLLLLLCIAKIFIDCSNVRNNCVDRTG